MAFSFIQNVMIHMEEAMTLSRNKIMCIHKLIFQYLNVSPINTVCYSTKEKVQCKWLLLPSVSNSWRDENKLVFFKNIFDEYINSYLEWHFFFTNLDSYISFKGFVSVYTFYSGNLPGKQVFFWILKLKAL